MSDVPSAEEFIRNEYEDNVSHINSINCEGHHVRFMMQEFAKQHREKMIEVFATKAAKGFGQDKAEVIKLLEELYPKNLIE